MFREKVKAGVFAGDNHGVASQLDEQTGRVIGRLTLGLVGALAGPALFFVGVGTALYVEMSDDDVPLVQDCSVLLSERDQADCWESNAAAEKERASFWNPAVPWFIAGSTLILFSVAFGVWSSYSYAFNRRREAGVGDIH